MAREWDLSLKIGEKRIVKEWIREEVMLLAVSSQHGVKEGMREHFLLRAERERNRKIRLMY